MSLRAMTPEVFGEAFKGDVYLVADCEEFSRGYIEDVINGNNDDDAYFLGALGSAPSYEGSRETINYGDNIYGMRGPIKGGWDIQSQTHTISASLVEANDSNVRHMWPDIEELGDWESDDSDPETYGKMYSPSGKITNDNYTKNVVLVAEAPDGDGVGDMLRLNNAINTADSTSIEFDDDGNIVSVDVELQAHEEPGTEDSDDPDDKALVFYRLERAETSS